ncbi:hypothetical protein [Burkholderia sp. USMB20]|uniref:hypothetical protein n=1 Tax=Burkholderia sp. USMB20 TaxID=1571773 RepID=UPI0005CED436|nr:hypothetical protein [Burkholderia sp. USMB20]TGN93672.1 hypothetical protein PL79_034550 [Burkholderia sp. USMB20]
MFQNNLKFAKVQVGVNGGAAVQWSATSIAIAGKVATFGADSVEVSVRRNEVLQSHGGRFREVAHAYYSQNPNHSEVSLPSIHASILSCDRLGISAYDAVKNACQSEPPVSHGLVAIVVDYKHLHAAHTSAPTEDEKFENKYQLTH